MFFSIFSPFLFSYRNAKHNLNRINIPLTKCFLLRRFTQNITTHLFIHIFLLFQMSYFILVHSGDTQNTHNYSPRCPNISSTWIWFNYLTGIFWWIMSQPEKMSVEPKIKNTFLCATHQDTTCSVLKIETQASSFFYLNLRAKRQCMQFVFVSFCTHFCK